MEMTPLPNNCHMGSDGRPHHKYGFSFVAVVEKCAGARRSTVSAKNLVEAGERGVELHAVVETIAKRWAEEVGTGQGAQLVEVFEKQLRGRALKHLSVSDTESIRRTVVELNPFFQAEPGMLFGTEELIELHDSAGEVISLGYYDIFLKIGRTVLIVDNKFVRKEVEAAEKNRQGHCLAVSVWQAYPDIEDVVVLFCMPDLESSMHRFTRLEDETRLTQELESIIAEAEQPYKTLQAGDHCVYCKFRTTCAASIGTVRTMVTGISPLAVPAGWAPQLVKSPRDMAILRYWVDTVIPICEAIKEESAKMAKENLDVSAEINGQLIKYVTSSRALPRQFTGTAVEVYEAIKDWVPPEAFISALKLSVTNLEGMVVALISDRLLQEGKTPSAKKIADDFSKMLMDKNLLTREEGRTYFLRRVKASAAKKKKGQLAEIPEAEITGERAYGGPDSHDEGNN